ncbi:hypothetical protein [Niallia sp.]|uniref:hypothetical protein n=1 Tax=Niallia sp. TaxID=2837523 RepID=UPI00289DC76E|nr:hypothetical protein [Niallia sp.]
MERYIYLVFTDTGTYFTRLIKFFTKRPYNHASLSMDADLYHVYSFGRKNIRNPFEGGFVREEMGNEFFHSARATIYRCSVTEEQYQKTRQLITRFDEQRDQYKYNLLGLFAIALKKQWSRKNAFCCSQFVAFVLEEAGIIRFEKSISLVTPQDLSELTSMDAVFEGELADYLNRETIMYVGNKLSAI